MYLILDELLCVFLILRVCWHPQESSSRRFLPGAHSRRSVPRKSPLNSSWEVGGWLGSGGGLGTHLGVFGHHLRCIFLASMGAGFCIPKKNPSLCIPVIPIVHPKKPHRSASQQTSFFSPVIPILHPSDPQPWAFLYSQGMLLVAAGVTELC